MANIIGTPGNDRGINALNGTNGPDTINRDGDPRSPNGTRGADELFGFRGNDILYGGPGSDRLDGGSHRDTASYVGATAGVKVNLNLTGPQNTRGAGTDTLVSIENLTGSRFNDVLLGNGANNVLSGMAGNDTLHGGGGDGRFGAGDWLEFRGERLAKNRLPRALANVSSVYVLSCSAGPTAKAPPPASNVEHLEEDRIFIRLPAIEDDTELWFWQKLASGDSQASALPLLHLRPGDEVRLPLRGWSRPSQRQAGVPDHRVEITVGGRPPAAFDWTEPDDGSMGETFVLPPLRAGESEAGKLELRVPLRRLPSGALLPDVVLVDWVEIARSGETGEQPMQGRARVELDVPSDWRARDLRADLLVVGPRDLLGAAASLVEVKEGLSEGDLVVARSGTFLRDGDAVRPILSRTTVSEAR